MKNLATVSRHSMVVEKQGRSGRCTCRQPAEPSSRQSRQRTCSMYCAHSTSASSPRLSSAIINCLLMTHGITLEIAHTCSHTTQNFTTQDMFHIERTCVNPRYVTVEDTVCNHMTNKCTVFTHLLWHRTLSFMDWLTNLSMLLRTPTNALLHATAHTKRILSLLAQQVCIDIPVIMCSQMAGSYKDSKTFRTRHLRACGKRS